MCPKKDFANKGLNNTTEVVVGDIKRYHTEHLKLSGGDVKVM